MSALTSWVGMLMHMSCKAWLEPYHRFKLFTWKVVVGEAVWSVAVVLEVVLVAFLVAFSFVVI